MVPVMISSAKWNRHVLPLLGAGILLFPAASFGTGQKFEKRFTVKGRPVVSIQNVANGRIEVKSSKTQEIIVTGSQLSNKIGVESEQPDDRIDVTATVLDPSAPAAELEENFSLVVPEETELQIRTQSGLIYVEQVMGDMKLESIAGDVHLKEVSGYIIVHSTGGSLICTLCAGKLEFSSISGNAQILQPSLNNVNIMTTSGNILYDGDFFRTGLYTMKSGKGVVAPVAQEAGHEFRIGHPVSFRPEIGQKVLDDHVQRAGRHRLYLSTIVATTSLSSQRAVLIHQFDDRPGAGQPAAPSLGAAAQAAHQDLARVGPTHRGRSDEWH
jgi:hypothetical protein